MTQPQTIVALEALKMMASNSDFAMHVKSYLDETALKMGFWDAANLRRDAPHPTVMKMFDLAIELAEKDA